MQNKDKPLFTLTIEEFIELTRKVVDEALLESDGAKQIRRVSNEEEYFNIPELAKFLKCSKVSIHKYKQRGLPYLKIGRKILFKKSEVLNFLKGLRNKRVIEG